MRTPAPPIWLICGAPGAGKTAVALEAGWLVIDSTKLSPAETVGAVLERAPAYSRPTSGG